MDKRVLNHLSLVTPRTVLRYWEKMVKERWRHPSKNKPGRPPVNQKIINLVLKIKILNPLWGYLRISGELKNLGIDMSKDTVCRILHKGWKNGDLAPNGNWKAFLSSHWDTICYLPRQVTLPWQLLAEA